MQGGRYIIFLSSTLFLLLSGFFGVAQNLTDTLQAVEVSSEKLIAPDDKLNYFSSGQKITAFDSATLQQYQLQATAQLLSQQTPVFVKSYGFNGLATLNIRGSSAAQSLLLWNGVPINNAALGIADVSSLPVALFDQVQLVYGSSSSLMGSGNVGGALLLSSGDLFRKAVPKWELGIGTGSFGQFQAAAKTLLQKGKLRFATTGFVQTAQNNFEFRNYYDEQQHNDHAHLKGVSLQQQIGFAPNNKDKLRLIGWYQYYDRQIPAARFESYSEKQRRDASWRIFGDWNRRTDHQHSYLRLAFIQDFFRYDDDTIGVHSSNRTTQLFFEAGWQRSLGLRHRLLLFTPVNISWMEGDTLPHQQGRYGLAAAYHYHDLRNKFSLSLSLREELIQAQSVFLPGVGVSYRMTKLVGLRAGWQRTYRAPTLNELYYRPGGNEDLEPEQGWSLDVGYTADLKLSQHLSLRHDVSVYDRVINNWIIWMGGAIWTPHNLATVESRGVETENILAGQWQNTGFQFTANAGYTVAHTTASIIPNDGSLGKQIPYTPYGNLRLNARFHYRNFIAGYHFSYVGKRFINTDESGAIPAYQISNVELGYSLRFDHDQFNLSAQLNNVFDEQYEVVNGRPMPGRNWMLSLSWKHF